MSRGDRHAMDERGEAAGTGDRTSAGEGPGYEGPSDGVGSGTIGAGAKVAHAVPGYRRGESFTERGCVVCEYCGCRGVEPIAELMDEHYALLDQAH